MDSSIRPPAHDAQRLASLLRGNYVAQAIYVAARLGIADILALAEARGQTSCSTAHLAHSTGAHEDSLYRLLRALAGENLFDELPDRHFALASTGRLLRADLPGSLRPAALLAGDMQYKVWAAFRESIKTGTTAFDRIFRKSLFPFLDEHPDMYALFNQAMTQQAARAASAVVATIIIPPNATIVDIGGGLGGMLLALLEKHPTARGILFDSPRVITEARDATQNSPAGNRLTFHPGDFFQSVPTGDIFLLAAILHMFQDSDALHVLKNCRASLSPTGRIYLIERLIGPPNESDPAKWDDLNMLTMTGGRERTFEEYAALLTTARFTQIERAAENIVTALVESKCCHAAKPV